MAWSYSKQAPPRPKPWWLGGFTLAGVWNALSTMPLVGTILAVVLLAVVAVVVLGAVALYVLLGPVAIPKELPAATAASSTVYAADGTVLATWHGPIDRQPVSLDQMSPYLAKAVVAEEDARFYSEPAVDVRSVLRAALTDLQAGRVLEGGSTITQQYVKDAFVGSKPTLTRKLLEARVALQLSRTLSKDQIMQRYLNTVYFGAGAYGVQAAARTYFGVDASQVTVSQAALLAGIIHAPDRDSPQQNPTAADADRLRVIGRMQALGTITADQAQQARGETTRLVAANAPSADTAWFMDAVRTSLIQQYGADAVYSGGLQIHTTLDPSAQAAAEISITGALPAPADPYAAVVSVDPATGYVRAIVGGKDYSQQQFNIATMGRRQPGSAFKPFVLATALEQGISPQALYHGPATLCLKGWNPGCVSNFGGESFGSISLLDATVHSVNTVYAQLILQVGAQNVVATANKMGIPGPADVVPPQVGCRPLGSEACGTFLPAVPSLALGSAGVTPLEMASAYATLAAGGVYRAPKLVSEVRDAAGNLLDSGPSAPVQALPAPIAQEVTQILQQVIQRGTGTAAAIGQPAAGKTGTAQNFDNAWFVGYTPSLASAVWVGDRDTNQPLLNVEGVPQVTGGTIPAHIWSSYMQAALDTDPPTIVLAGGMADAAVTNQKALAFNGTAADDTGNVVQVEASLDGAPFSADGITCSGCGSRSVRWAFLSPQPLADGAHTLQIRAVDMAGRASPVLQRAVVVDTKPPTLAGLSVTGGATDLGLQFSKPLACSSLDPAAFVVATPARTAAPAALTCTGAASASVTLTAVLAPRGGDPVTVRVWPQGPSDLAGNHFAAAASVSATASNLPPVIAVGGGAPALTNATRPIYQGTATDPDGSVAGIEASVDAGPFADNGSACLACGRSVASQAGLAPWTWRAPQALADGVHVIALRSIDNAGAASAVVTQTVTVDTVPPQVTALAATGGSATVVLTFSKPLLCSSLNPGDVAIAVQGRRSPAAAAACPLPASASVTLTASVPPRGGDTVVATVSSAPNAGPTDRAGNPVAQPGSVSGTATNLPPSLVVTGGIASGGLTNQAQPTYQGTATDPDGSIAGIQASIDGGPFAGNGSACPACASSGSPEGVTTWSWRSPVRLPDGAHVVALRAVDNAGAVSDPVQSVLTIDTAAPKPTGLQATGGAPVVTMTFSKELVCASVTPGSFSLNTAGRSALVYTVDCPGATASTVRLTLDRPVRGGDAVSALVSAQPGGPVDMAGNALANPRVSATATNAAPTIALQSAPIAGITSDPQPAFTGTATDGDGTVVAIEASIDGGPLRANGFTCTGCGAGPTVGGPTAWSYRPPRLVDGAHTIALVAVDNAGAASPEVTQTVRVDTSPPRLQGVTATVGSPVVAVIFSKPVLCSSLNVGEFDVTEAGSPVMTIGLACPDGEDALVQVTVSQAPASGDAVGLALSRGVADGAGRAVHLPSSLTVAAVAGPVVGPGSSPSP